MDKIQILCISDTHSKHHLIPHTWLDIPNKQNTILIHGGDISNVGQLNDIESFCQWYDKLDFPHKIFIAGNHDWGFQRYSKDVATIISKYPTITYLQDSSVTIEGVKIYGSPWQPEFFNWAFNLKRGLELQEKWDMIDEDTNILITHGPVWDILDQAPDGRLTGCENLLETIKTKLPKVALHICGHIHCGHGTKRVHDRLFVNASTLNEQYMVTNEPILIEYNKENNKANTL